ncbi:MULTISPECIES: patatin-like phospholipase family protein [Spirulina sp. CCY15215]|uniref:patatin-like phospholipase family protein n=1 Tax=Spirulina sp. CCY15215 TaxID=2767591 RepID=UPI0019512EFF|nr:patatin-like phospholipase family protein [Spirulina major]
MTFKILSLDGGGMRGALSAKILQAVERELWEKKKLKLHEYFDAIAGVSTGSILAAGLAKGKTCQELLELYQQNGDRKRSKRLTQYNSNSIRCDRDYPNTRV